MISEMIELGISGMSFVLAESESESESEEELEPLMPVATGISLESCDSIHSSSVGTSPETPVGAGRSLGLLC